MEHYIIWQCHLKTYIVNYIMLHWVSSETQFHKINLIFSCWSEYIAIAMRASFYILYVAASNFLGLERMHKQDT